MLIPLGPFQSLRPIGPLTPPVVTDPGVKGAPDMVPVVQCGVNAQGQRFVNIWVRNDGAEPVPRTFVVDYFIRGRGFIAAAFPVFSLPPGRAVLVESSADEILQGIQRLAITVNVDRERRIPEEINRSDNQLFLRCPAMPIVQSGVSPLSM